jgi:hypothetical protein
MQGHCGLPLQPKEGITRVIFNASLKRLKLLATGIGLCVVMVLPVWFLLAGDKAPQDADADPYAVPMGKGAGVFGRDSLFAPLKERADVVPWQVLTRVSTKVEKNQVVAVFTPAIQALDNKVQRIQGYMMPLASGEQQRHFLLSSVPLTCPFCTPGGPESMVEVTTRAPVRYSMEALVVEGKLAVLAADPSGLYYRMGDAASVQ